MVVKLKNFSSKISFLLRLLRMKNVTQKHTKFVLKELCRGLAGSPGSLTGEADIRHRVWRRYLRGSKKDHRVSAAPRFRITGIGQERAHERPNFGRVRNTLDGSVGGPSGFRHRGATKSGRNCPWGY